MSLESNITKSLSFLKNKTIRTIILVLLIIYGAGVAPMLDLPALTIMNCWWVKLLVLLLITWLAHGDLTVALLLAIVYVMTLCRGGAEGFLGSDVIQLLGFGGTKKDTKEDEKQDGTPHAVPANLDKQMQEGMIGNDGGPLAADSKPCLQGGHTGSTDLQNNCVGYGGPNNVGLNAQGIDKVSGVGGGAFQGSWGTI